MNRLKTVSCLLPFLWFLGCEVKPEPISFGNDQCHYCKMNIVDPKFGGELVTSKGKIYKFDALECLIPSMEEMDQEYAFTLGIAYNEPKILVDVDSLQFVISDEFNSPMGAHLAAFNDVDALDTNQRAFDWEGVKKHLSSYR